MDQNYLNKYFPGILKDIFLELNPLSDYISIQTDRLDELLMDNKIRSSIGTPRYTECYQQQLQHIGIRCIIGGIMHQRTEIGLTLNQSQLIRDYSSFTPDYEEIMENTSSIINYFNPVKTQKSKAYSKVLRKHGPIRQYYEELINTMKDFNEFFLYGYLALLFYTGEELEASRSPYYHFLNELFSKIE